VSKEWTLAELVGEVGKRIEALPPPRNGQVRAVPDDRTVRYYGTIGLLDRPLAMRGRTALYGPKHLAQVVAIKRFQNLGRSLAEIQATWPTLDDVTLARMSGVALAVKPVTVPARKDFWKHEIVPTPEPVSPAPEPPTPTPMPTPTPTPMPTPTPIELRLELAPGVSLLLAMPETGVLVTPADLRAIRDAAASLVTELASRHLTPNNREETL
jgi:hypothetical protein